MDNSATIKDVAFIADVSKATVSYVVNGKAEKMKISPATQARVLAAVRQTGYTPNRQARDMALGRGSVERGAPSAESSGSVERGAPSAEEPSTSSGQATLTTALSSAGYRLVPVEKAEEVSLVMGGIRGKLVGLVFSEEQVNSGERGAPSAEGGERADCRPQTSNVVAAACPELVEVVPSGAVPNQPPEIKPQPAPTKPQAPLQAPVDADVTAALATRVAPSGANAAGTSASTIGAEPVLEPPPPVIEGVPNAFVPETGSGGSTSSPQAEPHPSDSSLLEGEPRVSRVDDEREGKTADDRLQPADLREAREPEESKVASPELKVSTPELPTSDSKSAVCSLQSDVSLDPLPEPDLQVIEVATQVPETPHLDPLPPLHRPEIRDYEGQEGERKGDAPAPPIEPEPETPPQVPETIIESQAPLQAPVDADVPALSIVEGPAASATGEAPPGTNAAVTSASTLEAEPEAVSHQESSPSDLKSAVCSLQSAVSPSPSPSTTQQPGNSTTVSPQAAQVPETPHLDPLPQGERKGDAPAAIIEPEPEPPPPVVEGVPDTFIPETGSPEVRPPSDSSLLEGEPRVSRVDEEREVGLQSDVSPSPSPSTTQQPGNSTTVSPQAAQVPETPHLDPLPQGERKGDAPAAIIEPEPEPPPPVVEGVPDTFIPETGSPEVRPPSDSSLLEGEPRVSRVDEEREVGLQSDVSPSPSPSTTEQPGPSTSSGQANSTTETLEPPASDLKSAVCSLQSAVSTAPPPEATQTLTQDGSRGSTISPPTEVRSPDESDVLASADDDENANT